MRKSVQKEDLRENIKWMIMLLTGFLFIVTAAIGYIPLIIKNGMHEVELTLLSNTIAGILFAGGGIAGFLKKKEIPQALYMNSILVLQLVFFICMVFIKEFNFSGAFIFLHIINPAIATIEFLFFSSCNKKPTVKLLLTALIVPYSYLLYAIIYGYLSGNWIYGILNIPERGIVFVLILVTAAGAGILFLECIWYSISFFISQKRFIMEP